MILERFKVPEKDQVLVSEAALRRTVTQIFEKLGVTCSGPCGPPRPHLVKSASSIQGCRRRKKSRTAGRTGSLSTRK